MFFKLQHFSHVLDYITKKKIQIQKKSAENLRWLMAISFPGKQKIPLAQQAPANCLHGEWLGEFWLVGE